MKASDISDEAVFAVVDRVLVECGRWTVMRDLWEAFPEFPGKVVQAKMRQMVAKGRISGCGCGCRGDFERNSGRMCR